MTLKCFMGGFGTNPNIPFFGSKPTKSQIENNIAFAKNAMGYEWKLRSTRDLLNIDESQIKSGTYLGVTRFEGLNTIIHYGSGSPASHSVVTLWIDGVLYCVESQGGWFWPQQGIQRTPWKQWIQWAQNADFNVVMLQLNEENQGIFDEKKAFEWFKTVEGLPYGYHNFLFGWIDTPDKNFPDLLDLDFLIEVLSIVEKVSPSAIDKLLLQGLNKRLNTTGLSLVEISNEVNQRGMTIGDLMAMPEIEGWEYSDGKAYVCSSFVAGLYKAAGLFHGLSINVDNFIKATEFTPRDVYSLNIFEKQANNPECMKNDPEIPYCQLMGDYRIVLPGFNTIKPYSLMNERCPSLAPDFIRPDGC